MIKGTKRPDLNSQYVYVCDPIVSAGVTRFTCHLIGIPEGFNYTHLFKEPNSSDSPLEKYKSTELRLKGENLERHINEEGDKFRTMGNVKYAMGHYVGAIADYDKALLSNPFDYKSLANRAVSKTKLTPTWYSTALVDCQWCVLLAPQWAKGFYRYAVTASLLNNIKGIGLMNKAAKLEPNNKSFKKALEKMIKALPEEWDFDKKTSVITRHPEKSKNSINIEGQSITFEAVYKDTRNPPNMLVYIMMKEKAAISGNSAYSERWLASTAYDGIVLDRCTRTKVAQWSSTCENWSLGMSKARAVVAFTQCGDAALQQQIIAAVNSPNGQLALQYLGIKTFADPAYELCEAIITDVRVCNVAPYIYRDAPVASPLRESIGPKSKYNNNFMQNMSYAMFQDVTNLDLSCSSRSPGKELIKKLYKFKNKNSAWGWMPKMLQGVFPLTQQGAHNGLSSEDAVEELKRRVEELGFGYETADGAIRQTITTTVRYTLIFAYMQNLATGNTAGLNQSDLLSKWVEDFYDGIFYHLYPKPPGLEFFDPYLRYGEEVIDYSTYSSIFRGSFLLGVWAFRMMMVEQTGGHDEALDAQSHYHEKLVSLAQRIIMKGHHDFMSNGKATYEEILSGLHHYIIPQTCQAWTRIASWGRRQLYLLYDHDLGGVVSELQSPYKYTLKAKCGKENIYIRSRLVMYTGLGMQQNEELAQKSEEDFWTKYCGFQMKLEKYPGWKGYDDQIHGYKHNTDAITAVAYRAAAHYCYDDDPNKRLFLWNAAYFACLSTNEGGVRSDFPHITDKIALGELFEGFGMTRFYNLGYLRDLVKKAEEATGKINRNFFNPKAEQKIDCKWLPMKILEMCTDLPDLTDLPDVNRIQGKINCYTCVDPVTGKTHTWNEFKDREYYLKQEKGGVDVEQLMRRQEEANVGKLFNPFKEQGARLDNMWNPLDKETFYFEGPPRLSLIALDTMHRSLGLCCDCTDPKKAESKLKERMNVDALVEEARKARISPKVEI
ncbi:hypothetical protein TrST_g7124 [Triparma strigata]|uniref:Uncharacterized protein n=1 Tax=Triparma strigata TaxID=1606541 RepID=A0A9W7B7J1_9STRA|nr:hypothetical protein TrST_g7124 [Triparma strigata]